MVTVKVQAVCNDNAKQADFVISITSPGGTAGIESVVVTALDGSVVNKQTPQGCPPDFQFSVSAAYSALPVYVAVTECQSGVDQGQAIKVKTSAGPFGKECLGLADCGAPGQNQNNQKCIDLQNDITKRRNQILIQCGDAAALKSQRDALLIAAAAFLAASIATATIAFSIIGVPLWGQIVATVLFVTAALFLGVSTYLGAAGVLIAIQLGNLQGQMDEERQELADQIQKLRDVCCTEFINPNLFDIPVCPN